MNVSTTYLDGKVEPRATPAFCRRAKSMPFATSLLSYIAALAPALSATVTTHSIREVGQGNDPVPRCRRWSNRPRHVLPGVGGSRQDRSPPVDEEKPRPGLGCHEPDDDTATIQHQKNGPSVPRSQILAKAGLSGMRSIRERIPSPLHR